jgi:hypothetical protein
MTPAARLSRLAPIGLGLAYGIYFVSTSPYRSAQLWPVWAPLAVAFTATAGAVYVYGLNRWAEVSEAHNVRPREVAGRIAAIVAIPFLVLIGSTQLSGSVRSSGRHVLLIGMLILGGVPAAGVMDGIRHAANRLVPGTRGQQVVALVGLRRLLQRLLTAVGSLVALSTLAIGASVTLEQRLAAQSGQSAAATLPPEFVLVFGGAGSLLVAVFYVPAAGALDRRGQSLSAELFPLDEADEGSAILSLAENRNKLEQLLGVGRGAFADLQTGLAILGPLLASAAAAFLAPR